MINNEFQSGGTSPNVSPPRSPRLEKQQMEEKSKLSASIVSSIRTIFGLNSPNHATNTNAADADSLRASFSDIDHPKRVETVKIDSSTLMSQEPEQKEDLEAFSNRKPPTIRPPTASSRITTPRTASSTPNPTPVSSGSLRQSPRQVVSSPRLFVHIEPQEYMPKPRSSHTGSSSPLVAIDSPLSGLRDSPRASNTAPRYASPLEPRGYSPRPRPSQTIQSQAQGPSPARRSSSANRRVSDVRRPLSAHRRLSERETGMRPSSSLRAIAIASVHEDRDWDEMSDASGASYQQRNASRDSSRSRPPRSSTPQALIRSNRSAVKTSTDDETRSAEDRTDDKSEVDSTCEQYYLLSSVRSSKSTTSTRSKSRIEIREVTRSSKSSKTVTLTPNRNSGTSMPSLANSSSSLRPRTRPSVTADSVSVNRSSTPNRASTPTRSQTPTQSAESRTSSRPTADPSTKLTPASVQPPTTPAPAPAPEMFYAYFPTAAVRTPSLKPRELDEFTPKKAPSMKRHSK